MKNDPRRTVFCLAVWCAQSAALPSFEVASVKVTPVAPVRQPFSIKGENGRLTIRNNSIGAIIQWAFGVVPADTVLPSWANDPDGPRYDIDGKADESVPPAELKLMLQKLLADRFQFAAHHEMREGVHQVLRVGKRGAKLREAGPPVAGIRPVRNDQANQRIVCQGATLADFLYYLGATGSGRIYDRTGLTGRYDFTLDYGNYLEPAPTEKALNAAIAARIDAMRAQLGLEVVDAKISVDTFVVDRIEKIPTGN